MIDRDDLKATAESLMSDAERVHQLEAESVLTDPDSQRFRDLSDESQQLTEAMAAKARIQRRIAEDLRREPRES